MNSVRSLNRRLFACLLAALLACVSVGRAQISPGELSSAHAALDGVAHCTQCHSIGKETTNEKCLSCHTEIKQRIDARTGYHGTIGSKHCDECHKEHHGKAFKLIRFDPKTFDHASIGYPLIGKHQRIECVQCHSRSKLTRKNTYLGLQQDCKSCHEDVHRGQFTGTLCTRCHGMDQWKPPQFFSHERTKFPLAGKHAVVECSKCHAQKMPDGKSVKYSGINFSTCSYCHQDPHKGKFKQACVSCHTTDGWDKTQQQGFNHSATGYALLGKHAGVKCEKCHGGKKGSPNANGTASFRIAKYDRCTDCHQDVHKGQLVKGKSGGKCEACHSVAGFRPAHFSLQDHAAARLPLEGAHAALPCIKCHPARDKYRWEGAINCQTCHRDIHAGQFASKMTHGCETCHTTEAWDKLLFSHGKTKFALRGKHAQLECGKCHFMVAAGTPDEHRNFLNAATVCEGCHKEPHRGQFAMQGKTACDRCHAAEGWHLLSFNHDTQTGFALTGKHTGVACAKCHKEEGEVGNRFVRYKPLGKECKDCHKEVRQ
jgi:hypothetical protein